MPPLRCSKKNAACAARLGSLIGRDLGDRQDDVTDRAEPPMQSTPMPHVAPQDRIGQSSVRPPVPEPAAVAPRAAPTAPPTLPSDVVVQLKAALAELTECRQLIDAAVARPQAP